MTCHDWLVGEEVGDRFLAALPVILCGWTEATIPTYSSLL